MIQKLKGNVPSYTVEAAYGKTWSEISFASDLYEFTGQFRYPAPCEFYLTVTGAIEYYDNQAAPPHGPRLILQRIQTETVIFTQIGTVQAGQKVPDETFYSNEADIRNQMYFTHNAFICDREIKIYRRSVTSAPRQ